MNFVALAVIADIDNFYYNSLRQGDMRSEIENPLEFTPKEKRLEIP
jgi:hypothetical protein